MTIKSINIQCPHCGTEYGVEQNEIGSQVECQVCGEKFVISKPIKSIDINCPHCGTEYGVEQSEIGSQVECQVCGEKFVISSSRPKAGGGRTSSSVKKSDKERTIISVKPSIAPIVVRAFLFIAPIAIFLGVLGLKMPSEISCYFFVPLLIVVLFVLWVLGLTTLIYCKTEYTVTNKRLICKSGIITENIRQVQVQDMRDIFLVRTVTQKITNTGSISIGSQTTGISARIILSNIKEYQSVIATLESLRGK